jgi:hypothetical protein
VQLNGGVGHSYACGVGAGRDDFAVHGEARDGSFEFDGGDVVSARADVSADVRRAEAPAGLDAERDRREVHEYTFHQALALATDCGDALANFELRQFSADLDADRAIAMSGDRCE